MKPILATLPLLIIVWLAILIFPTRTLAQSNPVRLDNAAPRPANLDFEEGEPGKVPTGWFATTASTGYVAELSTDQPKSGKQCAVLRGEKATGQFGILLQVVDATAYRGHRIRLRAALRAEEARAQLWLRVDLKGRRTGFFDNMMDRPVTSATWTTVEITGDVDDDSEVLNFGLLMLGNGKTYIDEVTLDDLGKLVEVAEPPRPLTASGLANVEAFARLVGYVRHFHPSDEGAATDWNSFAVEGVRQVEGATSPDDLARRLESLFHSVAPTVRVFVTGKIVDLPKEIEPPAGPADIFVTQWRHKGFGGSGRANTYSSERVRGSLANGKVPDGFHDPRKPFITKLAGGVTCSVPLALFADSKGTFPHRSSATSEDAKLMKYSGNDRATRLADAILAWNIFEHFYPYFDVVSLSPADWLGELRKALVGAANDQNDVAFIPTLRRMVAALHDGHGAVQSPLQSYAAAIPILWSWVENQLVITTVGSGITEGLKPGDIIEKIDGRPSRAVIEETEHLISSATPQWARVRALQELRSGSEGSSVVLELRTLSGEHKSVTLKRTTSAFLLDEIRPEKIAEVKPGVFYVDVDRVSDADFTAALPKLERARGIVFDLRGYPNHLSAMPLRHLTDTPLQSARWNVPIISDPDWTGTPGWETGGRWNLQPAAPRLKGKIAFITDGRAVSYAESWMGIVEAYKLGAIVGETTAGTNGDTNPFTLLGGYRIYWTGMKVLKHDGSRHHGVGIAPTVPVSRTIRGVAEGRDEQLERAIAVVGEN